MDMNRQNKYIDSLIFPLKQELKFLEREEDVLNFYRAKVMKKEESTHGDIITFIIVQAFDHNKNPILRKFDFERIFKEDESIKVLFDLKKTPSFCFQTKILSVNEKRYTFLTIIESLPREFYLRLDGSIFTTYKTLQRLKKIRKDGKYLDVNILNAINSVEETTREDYQQSDHNETENFSSSSLKYSEDFVDIFKNLKLEDKNLIRMEKEYKDFIKKIKKLGFLIEYNKLNNSQKESLLFSKKNKSYRIIGPPGSGKTKVVVEIVKTLLYAKKSVLVCGPSNISVDNILSSIIDSEYYKKIKPKLYKLGSFLKTSKTLSCYHIESMANESVLPLLEKLNQAIDNKSDQKTIKALRKKVSEKKKEFIMSTIRCTDLAFATLFSSYKMKDNKYFDWIIIDEACQARESESFLSVLLAKKFILVGDPYQLGPTVKSETVELKSTFFDRICSTPTFFLNEQYRMSKLLISFSNSYFYSNRIISSKKTKFKFFNRSEILFIDTSNHNSKESKLNSSIKNTFEAEITIKIIKYLESKQNIYDVGIITPYSQQAFLIKDILPKVSFPIQVSTVDAFQGQEKGIIILNFVRANKQQEIGFLSDLKRTNVALTRCIHGLIIVANSATFLQDEFYIKLFGHLHAYAYCINPAIFDIILFKAK
ncbi:AAA domain-containing protein [Hamiltosporidium magnivora]|uniref:AAA domain-containing protein n=1 Tax=Hamiltosporidium magnivora TaxID=148818 RepID=A0A4V2JVE4_9MICR|nr:AAA domain-containing protein [Hamiltosporidium magnivora]